MSLPILDQPTPCWGKSDLFESVSPVHHREAKRLCDQCPVFAACDLDRIATERDLGAIEGTWAGRFYDSRSVEREVA